VAGTPDEADLQRLLFTDPDEAEASAAGPAEGAQSGLPAGYRIDDFRVERLLGRGGMGAVYAARDERAGRPVALKLARAEAAREPRAAERARREGLAVAGLDHPGIVRVHAAGTYQGRPYLAFELVEGARHLDEAGPGLPLRRRVELARDAARALGHAHARGVVHRDVKGANLLLDAAGRVRVADFGLAARADLGGLTRSGALLGTPYTMAPEQLAAGEGRTEVGPPTDVWALGVVLYELLTGARPFDGGSLVELAAQVVGVDPVPPSRRSRRAPRALDPVVARALAKAPADRYPDGEALARDLDAFLAGELAAPRGRRVRLLIAGLAALGVVGVAGALGERIASGRVAADALADVAAWEAERLEPWRLGLGPPGAPAPTADALEARIAALAAARPRLDDAEAAAAEALGRRLEARRRLVAGDAPPDPGSDALGLERAVAALLLERTGRPEEAFAAAAGLEGGPDAALGRLVALELRARRRPGAFLDAVVDLPAEPALEALARRRLPDAVEAVCRAALRDVDGADGPALAARLDRLPAAGLADPAVLAAARGRALDAEAERWGVDVCADPDEAAAALAVVAAVAGGRPPARAGPPTYRAGADAVRRLLGPLPGEASGVPEARLLAAVALQEVLADVGAPVPERLGVAVWRRLLDRLHPVPLEVSLAVLRFGIRLNDDYAFNELRRQLRAEGSREALASADGRSRRVRFLRLALALPGDWETLGAARPAQTWAAARAVLEPGLREDLAPCYAAQVHLLLADMWAERGLESGPGGRSGPAREALRAAARALPDLWDGRLLVVASQAALAAAEVAGEPRAADALLDRAAARLEAARSRPPPPFGQPPAPGRALAHLRFLSAAWRWRSGAEELARADVARAAAVAGALAPREEAAERAQGARELLRVGGAIALAEEVVAPLADRAGFALDPDVAQVAVAVAGAHDRELARRRLALALELHPDDPGLRRLARELR